MIANSVTCFLVSWEIQENIKESARMLQIVLMIAHPDRPTLRETHCAVRPEPGHV